MTMASLIAVALIVAGMARLAPERLRLPEGEFTVGRLARFEVFSANLGTTIWGEYLPNAVTAPDLVDYRASAETSAGAHPQVRLERHRATQWSLRVSAPAPASVTFRTVYFPDWQATVDGLAVPAYGSTAMGLLTVDVPAGEHQVELSQGDTAPRRIGTLISILAALMLAGLVAANLTNLTPAPSSLVFTSGVNDLKGRGNPLPLSSRPLAPETQWREKGGRGDRWTALAVTALAALVIIIPNAVAVASPAAALAPMQASVAPGVELIGLGIEGAQFGQDRWLIPDARAVIHLQPYWHVKQAGRADAPVAWRLVDAAGRVVAQRVQMPRYGTAPQHSWVADEIVEDGYDLPLSVTVPRGTYALEVSYGGDQAFVRVGTIELDKGGTYAPVNPAISFPIDARLGDAIRLLGVAAAPAARPGDRYGVTLYWQAERDIFEDYAVSTQLLDAEGRLVAQHDAPPGEGLNPTSLWVPRDTIVEERTLALPRDLRPGTYTLIAVMYRPADMERLHVVSRDGPAPDNAVTLGTVEVR